MKAFIRINVAFTSGMIYMHPAVHINVFQWVILNNVLLGALISMPAYFVYWMGER